MNEKRRATKSRYFRSHWCVLLVALLVITIGCGKAKAQSGKIQADDRSSESDPIITDIDEPPSANESPEPVNEVVEFSPKPEREKTEQISKLSIQQRVKNGDVFSVEEVWKFMNEISKKTEISVTGTVSELHPNELQSRTRQRSPFLRLTNRALPTARLLPMKFNFSSAEDLNGLSLDQEVTIRGRLRLVDLIFKLVSLENCEIVKRGEIRKSVPPPLQVMTDNELNKYRTEFYELKKMEGIYVATPQSSSVIIEEYGILEDGTLPEEVLSILQQNKWLQKVELHCAIHTLLIEQVSTIQFMQSLRIVNQGGGEFYDMPKLEEVSFASLASHDRLIEISVDELTGLTPTHIRDLTRCPVLRKLSLSKSNDGIAELNDEHAKAFANSASLRELRFPSDFTWFHRMKNEDKSYKISMSDVGLKHILRSPGLRFLEIWSPNISGSGFSSLENCPEIESLDISGSSITTDGITSLRNAPSLARLDLSGTKIGNEFGKTVRNLKHLVSLNMQSTEIDDVFFQNSGLIKSLESLDVSSTKISDNTLKQIGNQHWENLNRLIVDRCGAISDSGVRQIFSSPVGKQLHVLSLAGNPQISDDSLIAIANAQTEFPEGPHIRLEELDIRETAVTAAGIERILKIDSIRIIKGPESIPPEIKEKMSNLRFGLKIE